MALRRQGGEDKEGGRGNKKTKRWEREKENDKREQTELKKQATTVPNIRQKKRKNQLIQRANANGNRRGM